MGVQIVDTETFADKDTDFSAQLTSIQSKNPDVLIIAGLYQEGALIMKKAREMGMNQPVIGNNGFNSPEYIKQAGAAADGTMVATPWNPARDSAKAQAFKKAYEAKYNHEPDQFAAQAYDAMYTIHEAIENPGPQQTGRNSAIPWRRSKALKGLPANLNLMPTGIPRWTWMYLLSKMGNGCLFSKFKDTRNRIKP